MSWLLEHTLNKILVEIGQMIGQSWSELVDSCPEMIWVKAHRVTNIQRKICNPRSTTNVSLVTKYEQDQ